MGLLEQLNLSPTKRADAEKLLAGFVTDVKSLIAKKHPAGDEMRKVAVAAGADAKAGLWGEVKKKVEAGKKALEQATKPVKEAKKVVNGDFGSDTPTDSAVDPGAAARIRENDLVRIVRALEIAAGGRTQSELFEAHRFAPRRYRYRLLAVEQPRELLHARIGERALAMARGGIVEEARALVARLGDPLPRLPIGYADALACARGEIDVDGLAARIALHHRRYARRQVIWLRREQDVEWIAPPFDPDGLARELRSAP